MSTDPSALIVGPSTTKDLQIRYPIISATIPASEHPTSRKKRRRHGTKSADTISHPPARFYNPPAELGGKGRGYGMGWRIPPDPYDVTTASDARYARAKMNKGVIEAQYPWATRVGR